MFAQNFTILPQSHFELIQLGIIAYIFCKTMNYMYHCQMFILMHKKGYYKYFPTSCILFTEWLFCPKFANFGHIQLDIIDYIFGKFMNQHCAKISNDYTIKYMDMTMLSFFSIFAWNLNNLPQKSNLGHIKLDIIINIFCKIMEYPCA